VAVTAAFSWHRVATGIYELLSKGRHMGYGICGRVFSADVCHARVGGFAGFRESVVARIKVLAFLLRAHNVSGRSPRVSRGKGDGFHVL
jgi:hypothetical protein